MEKFWQLFYNVIFIPAFYLIIKIASLFKKKIRTGIAGRKRIFEDLILNRLSLDRSKKIIWFHSSSLGEFEQAKPIIERLKSLTNLNIFVTFFSPSGYENSRRYPHADFITYIPFDSKWRANRFVEIVKPNLTVFMRYDIWPNHIWALKSKKIPIFLVDATMKRKSARKIPVVKSFHKYLFKGITRILTVSESDAKGFREFGCNDNSVKTVGDTRFDRVFNRSLAAKETRFISKEILKGKKVLVAGSTWEQDEEIIIPAFTKLAKFDESSLLIIAPHEPTLFNLEKIENEFARTIPAIRLSHLNNYSNQKIIIVDSIGVLSMLYSYASAAFIGGGFKQNVHNVLEAAIYGIPVLFGPKIENSQEAKKLIESGGAMLIKDKREAYRKIRTLFMDEELRQARGKKSYEYVQTNLGATDKIIKEILAVIK